MGLEGVTVHLVTGPREGGWPAVREAVLGAVSAGVRLVQYRDKHAPALLMVEQVRELIALCRKRKARIVVNDRLDVALAAGADGVHLGEDDLPWGMARRIAPPPFLIGCSAATRELALTAIAAGADYLGAGPAYATPSKPDAGEPIPSARYRALAKVCRDADRAVQLVAIGGIGPGGAAPLIRAGADAVAVIASVMTAPDPGQAAGQLLLEVAGALRAREKR